MDIKPYTSTRQDGTEDISVTGVIRFAILKLAEQIDEAANTPIDGFPSATELLAMQPEERTKWMNLSHQLAEEDDLELFEAFDDMDFDDV